MLNSLKSQNLITHKVFSIYTSLTPGNASSHIKFGGYDDNAVKPGSVLQFIKTEGPYTWEIPLENKSFKVAGQ